MVVFRLIVYFRWQKNMEAFFVPDIFLSKIIDCTSFYGHGKKKQYFNGAVQKRATESALAFLCPSY